MKFVKLNTALITTALHDHETTGTPVPFNTSFHPASDAPDLRRPIDTPYSFKRWLPLILSTRHTHHEHDSDEQNQCPRFQTVRLTLAQTRLLHAATDASLLTRQLNRLYRDDIADEIVPLLQRTLVFPARGLFLRLDACSPKDGAGALALRSVDDVVRKVVTSVRARNALFHSLQGHDQEQSCRVEEKEGRGRGRGQGEGLELFFLPFDERMAGDREYRVFCRPGDGRVTGVSQYRWYRAWRFQGLEEAEQEEVVRKVMEGAEAVRRLILEEVRRSESVEDKLLLEQGFSFDLFYEEEKGRCELVELNTYGVRSACGSCLFQWVEDRKVLYGEEEAEFRVSVDMLGLDGQLGSGTVRVSRLEDNDVGPLEYEGEDWRGFLRSLDEPEAGAHTI